jgi:hypothetical protein
VTLCAGPRLVAAIEVFQRIVIASLRSRASFRAGSNSRDLRNSIHEPFIEQTPARLSVWPPCPN